MEHTIGASLAEEARRFAARQLESAAHDHNIGAIVAVLLNEPLLDWSLQSKTAVAAVKRKLRLAIRRERGKALANARSYRFNRHLALHQALKYFERRQEPPNQTGDTPRADGRCHQPSVYRNST